MAVPQLFEWRDDLLTHVEVIDTQHKEYFNRVNGLLKHAAAGESAADVAEALDFVGSYAVFHFDSEQDAMRFADYPELDEHLEQHQHFATHLEKLTTSFDKDGFRPSLGRELNALLVDWFVHHIRTIDQKLGRFLQKA
ncbi:MAG: hemerythrin family protein, partial [Victivallales bacterium]|nr:hemerythrin family protein [Victivallales bacterium]